MNPCLFKHVFNIALKNGGSMSTNILTLIHYTMKKVYLLTTLLILMASGISISQTTDEMIAEAEGVLCIDKPVSVASPHFYPLSAALKKTETHILDSLSNAERTFIETSVEPVAIGVVRDMPVPLFFSLAAAVIPDTGEIEYAGGRLTRINEDTLVFTTSIRSKGADEVRFFIPEGYFPEGTQLNIFKDDSFGFTQEDLSSVLDENGFYTATCFGDHALLQFIIPKNLFHSGLFFTLTAVVHAEDKYLPDTKATCYQDANCSYANGFTYITNLKRATAQLRFPKDGGYYICSGGMLADNRSTDIQPFMLTANHCFSAQTSATGLEARFDYWSTSCGSTSSNPNIYIVYGANLIKTNSQSDFTLVLLKTKPGGTRYYLGWSTSSVANNATLHSVNHPSGTFQKYTRVQNKTSPTYNCSLSTTYFHYTTTLGGQTSGGSSGGVIVNASNQVVGQLYGVCHPTTWDDCSYSTYNGVWGKFASSYTNNNLQYWLNNGGASVKISSPTALSYDTVIVGSSKTLTITVTNSGTVPNYMNLEAGTISISGTDASQFSISGPTSRYLAPGASGTFTIVFTPTSAGTKTATLNIPHNANNVTSPWVVTLTGIGKNPIPNYSVTTMPNPFIAGLTIGDGTYQQGSLVYVQALENYGYVFENWTENGVVVSTDMQFSFIILSNRYLIANFSCILPFPAGTISGNTQVCQGENTVVYTVSQISYADYYEWTLPAGATGSSTTNTISIDFAINAISGYISVKGVNACGEGSTSSLSLTVNPLPETAGFISGNAQVCQGETAVVYSVSQIPNADFYEWTLPTGAFGSSTTNTISVDFASNATSGYISVKGVNACGKGFRSSQTITVNILPGAAGFISGNTEVCQGETAVVYMVPQIPNADYYEWTLPAGATGSSTTNTISINFDTNATSGNISVKGINACGAGSGASIAIIVKPLPVSANNISGNAQICQEEQTVIYSISQIPYADYYEWTLPAGVVGSSTTNTISIDFGTNASSGNISVKGINTCGAGSATSLAITVNPLPEAAGLISGNVEVCEGEAAVAYTVPLIAHADAYEWTLPAGVTGSSTSNTIVVDFGSNAVSGNISVKGINVCGAGSATSLAITVNPLPEAAGLISGNVQVCQGETAVTYTVPLITHADTYEWTLPAGATGSSTSNTIVVDFGSNAVSGNISVKGVNACGEGTASSLALTVNPLPEAAGLISGNVEVCEGEAAVAYTVPLIAHADAYEWTLPAGATGSSTSNTIVVDFATNATSGNISVKGINACGAGSATSLALTVNPLPEAAGLISGNAEVCEGENGVIYSVSQISNADFYQWTLPAGASGSYLSNSISLDFNSNAISGNISVKGINACGEGSASSLAITVNPLPEAAGLISGNMQVCQGEAAVTYTVPLITHADTYEWTLPAGATGSSTSNTIVVDFGTHAISGYISVKGVNACGESNELILEVVVNPLPNASLPITGVSTVCQGESELLFTVPLITHADTYIWTLPPGVSGNSTNNSIIVDFDTDALSGIISVSGQNTCGTGIASSIDITVHNKPQTPYISLNGNILTSDAPLGNQWYNQNGLINGAIDQNFTADVNGDYFVIVELSGCSSDTSNIVNLIISASDNLFSDANIMVYPNPFADEMYVEITNKSIWVDLEIIDIKGQRIYKNSVKDKVLIPTIDMASGMYFIRLIAGESTTMVRVVKE